MAKQQTQGDLFDRLVASLSEDLSALREQDELIENAKSYRVEISARVKVTTRDLETFLKYATDEQKQRIEALDLKLSEGTTKTRGLNPFSEITLKILSSTKGNALTNGQLYNAYVESVPTDEEAQDYTQFNIKIRQLFDSGRISKEQLDPNKKSRDDIITLVAPKKGE